MPLSFEVDLPSILLSSVLTAYTDNRFSSLDFSNVDSRC